MNAEIKPGYTKERQRLADIVPLEAPFTLFVSPTQICNFKCFYCTHSKSNEELDKIGFCRRHIDNRLFDKICDDAQKFGGKIKRVLFTGLGEPLANPMLPDMISAMREKKIAQGYEIVTNAYLLSHSVTDRLLSAGLTFLRVSIQGLTAKKYKEITGADIDFSRLLDNLTYFYSKKGSCKLYIKIMDACFDEGETVDDFYKMFGNICDHIYIEHLTTAQPSMMKDYSAEVNSRKTFYGDASVRRSVCPYAFYTLQIDSSGNTFPCPPLGHSEKYSLGNAGVTSIYDIWNSDKLYDLQSEMLKNGIEAVEFCKNCENYLCFTPEEDNLDNDREAILKRLEARKCQK